MSLTLSRTGLYFLFYDPVLMHICIQLIPVHELVPALGKGIAMTLARSRSSYTKALLLHTLLQQADHAISNAFNKQSKVYSESSSVQARNKNRKPSSRHDPSQSRSDGEKSNHLLFERMQARASPRRGLVHHFFLFVIATPAVPERSRWRARGKRIKQHEKYNM